ncbi:MAG: hypothetical protein EU541_04145 [Promethearchaeota archaeon]|nr:MAG: hypothetical protein EU541_04145 [Candidatus Lokiarchaeota archaeon]
MEIIKNRIEKDEKILWQKKQVYNFKRKLIISYIFIIIFLTIFLGLLALFFWYVPSWNITFFLPSSNIEIDPLFIFLIILFIFIGIAVFAVGYSIYLLKQLFQNLNLKISNLASYNLIYILTNKRWIQKDWTSFLGFDYRSIAKDHFSQISDVIFIDLSIIEKATIKRGRNNCIIRFYIKNVENSSELYLFKVKFELSYYQKFKNSLSNLISVEILKES